MKKLFATPKRAVITTCCIFLALILIAAAVTAIVVKNSLMDRTEACDAALTDARLLRSDVNGLKAELDLDDGEFRYDVEFYSAGVEYDYIIDASDGDVISRDVDGQPQDKDKAFDVDHAGVSDQSADIPDNADSSAAPADVTVSESDALSAALKDAGLSENQVTVVKSKLDYDDGVKVYDIEFYTDTKEYDYEINAATSAIVSRSSENLPSAGNTGNNGGNNNAAISESDALTAALKDAGLSENQVTVVKSKLDYDDGIRVYDIEFYTDTKEYDYEINAATSAIVSRSSENLPSAGNTGNNGGNNNTTISESDALSAALKDAGLSKSQVTVVKSKLDYDDGVKVYDIEFYSDGMEYEYEINAANGAILDRSKERA